MNFADAYFWGLLLGTLALLLVVRGLVRRAYSDPRHLVDKFILLTLSVTLLAAVSLVTFTIFAIVALGSYAAVGWAQRQPAARRRALLPAIVVLQLLPLLFYKYGRFFGDAAVGAHPAMLDHVIIPAGISFYTFQKIAFVVDTLGNGMPLPRLIDYLNFASFFPQIVAGPIERRVDLLPQMERFAFRWSARDVNAGLNWMAIGFFFKLALADNLALYLDPSSTTNAYLIWLANLSFGLRIYFDFAGYSLIALGLARCLGVSLTLNFRSPYSATSIGDFWRRWHVTLSQWFRDYLYVPLGGSRVKTWALNTLIVFAISGLWHGAGWNFILWGGIHGAALIASRLLSRRLSVPPGVGWALTLLVVFTAWMAFYETRLDVLVAKATSLATPAAYGPAALFEARAVLASPDGVVQCCLIALALATLLAERLTSEQERPYEGLFARQLAAAAVVVMTVLLAPGSSNGFIYFAF